MRYNRKAQRELIENKLQELARSYRSDSRRWWPNYLFHYTALQNVVSILEHGILYSRKEANRLRLLEMDGASPSVLSITSDAIKDFVRLYFRPKTPTQYSNEGIRPKNQLVHGSHCPIPVMLLFDSRDILTRKETQFSRGSLAGGNPGKRGNTAQFFEKLPFTKIYHNSWFDPSSKQEIIARRHAEVIVHRCLRLDALKHIWCRSEAEKQTLISSLSEALAERWSKKIFHGNKYDLFFAKWSFVDRVSLRRSGIEFYFNTNSKTPGPFDLYARLQDNSTGQILKARERKFMAKDMILLNFDNPIDSYSIELYLDDYIAYYCDYEETGDVF